MVSRLHKLETDLSINIFNIALRLVAHQLDDFFINSMIMNTKFSTGGSSQFDFDMNRNLFALFGQYAKRPDLLFKKYKKQYNNSFTNGTQVFSVQIFQVQAIDSLVSIL